MTTVELNTGGRIEMKAEEVLKEIEYYFTKFMIKDMVAKNVISTKEYDVVMEKIKAKYDPYFDLLSD